MEKYGVTAESGIPLGEYEAEDVREAVRLALDGFGHTVYPDPHDDTKLFGRHGQPVHIFCNYEVNGVTVKVRMLSDEDEISKA